MADRLPAVRQIPVHPATGIPQSIEGYTTQDDYRALSSDAEGTMYGEDWGFEDGLDNGDTDDDDEIVATLETPTILRIVSQTARTVDATTVVDIVVEVSAVERATNYEGRLAIQ